MSSKLKRLGLYSAVLVVFFAALRVNPSRAEMSAEESQQLRELGQERFRQRDYEGAIEPTLKLHGAYPDNPIYMLQLAESYHGLGRTSEEAEFWELYLTFSPTPKDACSPIMKAYRKLADHEKVIDAGQRCLMLDPTGSGLHFLLGYAYERAGRVEKAEATYRRGLELAQRHSDMQLGLARILFRTERVTDARELGLEVLDRDPDHPDALLLVGQCLRAAGDLEGAKGYLQRGVEVSGSYADFHRVLGGIAEQQKDVSAATRHYAEVLRLAPEDERIARRMDRLRTEVGQ